MEVLERPDSELIVQYQGHTVATQEPPPRMGALWASVNPWSPGPELKRIVSSMGDHHISKSPQTASGRLGTGASGRGQGQDRCRKGRRQQDAGHMGRTPTPTQKARWKAIHRPG